MDEETVSNKFLNSAVDGGRSQSYVGFEVFTAVSTKMAVF
jgi:hypothetical protein